MNILLHGIRIKRLDLTEAKSVTSADADFSRLSYYNKAKDQVMNGGNPFVSSTVISYPFDENTSLSKGVHLHFLLPITLTQFSNENDELFPAPNRWLIKRAKTSTKPAQSWVVESDFLSTERTANQHESVTTILPIDPDLPGYTVYENNGTKYSQPFRYIGRKVMADQWFENSVSANGEYWETLMSGVQPKRSFTAFVHGDPSFPSFYPNCRSVFGFHDPVGEKNDEYEVYGWHFNASNGTSYLKLINDTINKDSSDDLDEVLNNSFGFKFLKGEKPNDGDFERILFVGQIEEKNSGVPDLSKLKMAIGNDPGEAISAFLAKETDPNKITEIEDFLEASQFGFLDGKKLDIQPLFEAGRHAKRFAPREGVTLFSTGLFAKDGSAQTLMMPSLNNALGIDGQAANPQNDTLQKIQDLLWANSDYVALQNDIQNLNALLTEFDKGRSAILSRQRLLHAHWQKYLMAAHPPLFVQDITPDSDKILAYLADYSIPALDKLMKESGAIINDSSQTQGGKKVTLKIFHDARNIGADTGWTEIYYESIPFSPAELVESSLSNQVLTTMLGMESKIVAINATELLSSNGLQIGLTNIPGQRYFQPGLPSLLIAGSDEKWKLLSTDNFESDPQFQLNCSTKAYGCSSDFKTYLKDLYKGTIDTGLALAKKADLWTPIYLDWDVSFYPVDNVNNTDNVYNHKYLENIFTIKPDNAEFTLINAGSNKDNIPDDQIKYTDAVSAYFGRSMLTGYIDKYLKGKLEDITTLPEEIQPPYIDDVVANLSKYGYLVQSLSQFNHAYVQEMPSLQLPVGDPIGFSDYKGIYKSLKIHEYIGESISISPVMDFDFNPIRGGGFDLVRLHLIDIFGQRFPLIKDKSEAKDLIVPQTMLLPEGSVLKLHGVDFTAHAFLYPRYIQPAVVQLHWLCADSADNEILYNQNTKSSPVCGWVVSNHLEEWLDIYDSDGQHLGHVWANSDGIEFTVAPIFSESQTLDPDKSNCIAKNLHLKRFLKFIKHQVSDEKSFEQLVVLIDESQTFIDPEDHASHNDIQYLIGRPIALVRMQLSFETPEDYACRKDWASFEQMLENNQTEPITSEFEDVEIPLRIGDYRKLNDGIIAYWNDKDIDAGTGSHSNFYSPLTYYLKSAGEAGENVISNLPPIDPSTTQSLADDPHNFMMLFDPRCQVHVCSGILPMATLGIPDTYYKKALKALKIDFPITPAIFPQNKYRLKTPNIPDYTWDWVYKTKNGDSIENHTVHSHKVIQQAVFIERLKEYPELVGVDWSNLIDDGVLVKTNEDANKAYVLTHKLVSDESYATVGQNGQTKGQDLIDLFTKYSDFIAPPVLHAEYGQNELREGWLELGKIPDFIKELYKGE